MLSVFMNKIFQYFSNLEHPATELTLLTSSIWYILVCSDGRTVGACLDRNGLRPARYWRTSDDFVYVASEVCPFDVLVILFFCIELIVR